MNSPSISMPWFPTCRFSARTDNLQDQLFDDFDEQAEQLYGHDQSYTQLTSGKFQGRFLSAFLGRDVAIHVEYCNQSLEQEVSGSPDHYSIGLPLSAGGQFTANGYRISTEHLFLLPPAGSLHVVSPIHGAIMAVAIRKDAFLAHLQAVPELYEWVSGLDQGIELLNAGRLAERLREDALTALEVISQPHAAPAEEIVGQALLGSMTAQLALEWGRGLARGNAARTNSYHRFVECKNWLRQNHIGLHGAAELAQSVHTSKRSVELSFSKTLSIGPLTYLKLLRLHEVRRKLSDVEYINHSIGDIAAEHGFWDWSRFSRQYRLHFGELPSETRTS